MCGQLRTDQKDITVEIHQPIENPPLSADNNCPTKSPVGLFRFESVYFHVERLRTNTSATSSSLEIDSVPNRTTATINRRPYSC